jgi:hypothetical protein
VVLSQKYLYFNKVQCNLSKNVVVGILFVFGNFVLQALQLAHLHVSSFAAHSIMGHLNYKLAQDKADEMEAVTDDLVDGDLGNAPSEQFLVDIVHRTSCKVPIILVRF